MTWDFFPEAREEFVQAALEYEAKQSGLGSRFRDDVRKAVDWIVQHPFVLRERPGGFRRLDCSVFQHYIAYIVRGETIYIVAVAHARRFPEYWRTRLRSA
jgi:plasmid stabilization system protein ParE